MRFLPLTLLFLIASTIKPGFAQTPDLFHENIDTIASRFISLNIPDLEKIRSSLSMSGSRKRIAPLQPPLKQMSVTISMFWAHSAKSSRAGVISRSQRHTL